MYIIMHASTSPYSSIFFNHILIISHTGGEVYSWGTNSMGQCGQGSSSSSITKPGRVKGLDGVQVQQISAGTSHSIAWTAIPLDRYSSIHVLVYTV